jgi:hypothetical protein
MAGYGLSYGVGYGCLRRRACVSGNIASGVSENMRSGPVKKSIKIAALSSTLLLSLGLLSACGQAPWEKSLKDLEGVQVNDPGFVKLYNNVDKHPNIVVLCANGFGFWTTTRPDFAAAQRLPEMDAQCKSVQDKPVN